MNKKDTALRLAGEYLLRLSTVKGKMGKQCKRVADLCFLALPMKYRLTHKEFEELTK
jgi:hypothetical protein